MRWQGVVCGLVLGFFATTISMAQQEKRTAEDLGAPGKEHKRLDDLAGRWDVTLTYKLGPGQERKGTADCEAKWVLDGRFLRQEYTSEMQKKPFTVVQYLGFDRRKNKFVELKMDSMDTGVMYNEGALSNDGATITCIGERIDPQDGKSRRIRTVYTLKDRDHFTLEWFFTSADGKEEKVVELSHTRKKS